MAEGMTREQAVKFVGQAMRGTIAMVEATNENPLTLRDKVCSPNGTTIEAVKVLEAGNFMGMIEEAMAACAKKSKEMSRNE
jgi:pyrroline-5-carboxylate reductase